MPFCYIHCVCSLGRSSRKHVENLNRMDSSPCSARTMHSILKNAARCLCTKERWRDSGESLSCVVQAMHILIPTFTTASATFFALAVYITSSSSPQQSSSRIIGMHFSCSSNCSMGVLTWFWTSTATASQSWLQTYLLSMPVVLQDMKILLTEIYFETFMSPLIAVGKSIS